MPIIHDIAMRMLIASLGPHRVGDVVVVFREVGMGVLNHVGIVAWPKPRRGKQGSSADGAKQKVSQRQAYRRPDTASNRIGDEPAGML